MVDAPYGSTVTLLADGRVLIAGGKPGYSAVATAGGWLFDPIHNSLFPVRPMNSARSDHEAVLLRDGRVLVTGGEGPNEFLVETLAGAELFDPATGRFTAIPAKPSSRYRATAVRLADGRVLIVGGQHNIHSELWILDTAELYVP